MKAHAVCLKIPLGLLRMISLAFGGQGRIFVPILPRTKVLVRVFFSGTNMESHLRFRARIKVNPIYIKGKINWDKGQGMTELLGGKVLGQMIKCKGKLLSRM